MPLACAVALVLAAGLDVQQAATAAKPAPTADTINIPIESYALPNGLTVILSSDRTTPTVAVNAWYHVGSKNELPGRTGFAHLFEHVMFTEIRPRPLRPARQADPARARRAQDPRTHPGPTTHL